MLGQIKEAAKKFRACLPYGMVLALIFYKFGIDYGEDTKRLLHKDKHNERYLHHMGYKKIDDKWIRRAWKQEAATNSNSNYDDDDAKDDEGATLAIPFASEIPTSVAPSKARHST